MVSLGSRTHGPSSCRDAEEHASNLYRCWQALERIGVIDVFFELFDATHFEIEYRYPLSLKYLAERLSPEVV